MNDPRAGGRALLERSAPVRYWGFFASLRMTGYLPSTTDNRQRAEGADYTYSMTLARGAHLGPYEIGEMIGRGGMGEVYRATDTRLGREVAVKVLSSHLADDPASLARFRRE